MTTSAFWNVDNPLKPWGLFDPDAILDFPFDWSNWLTDTLASYASHTITCEAPLECVQSAESNGIIVARIQVAAGQTPEVGRKYSFTCHIVADDGQEDERTLYLKITER